MRTASLQFKCTIYHLHALLWHFIQLCHSLRAVLSYSLQLTSVNVALVSAQYSASEVTKVQDRNIPQELQILGPNYFTNFSTFHQSQT